MTEPSNTEERHVVLGQVLVRSIARDNITKNFIFSGFSYSLKKKPGIKEHMEFLIRKAVPEDAQSIHNLIKELCVYEKTPLTEVETTSQDLVDDGLRNNGYFNCLVAEIESSEDVKRPDDKKIVGYGLYFFGYSTWKGKLLYLEDIYVQPKYRGVGIGSSFFKRLGEIALEMKCGRIAFMCLDWNLPAKEFYNKIGAEEQPEWKMFHFKNEKVDKFLSRFAL